MPTLESVTLDEASDAGRVVFDVSGSGRIGWSAKFVQASYVYGSGEEVHMAGTCVLQMDISSVDSDAEFLRLSPANASNIVEILSYPVRASMSQTFVGVRAAAPDVDIVPAVLPGHTSITVSFSG